MIVGMTMGSMIITKINKGNNMRAPKVKLFIEIWKLKSIIKKYGFRLQDATLREMRNGWLEVVVNWTSEKDSYLFKYCRNDGKMFTDDATSQSLGFVNLSKRFKCELEIGIQLDNVKSKGRIKYDVEYFQNLKYGVAVYFSPKGWESNSKVIEEHTF